MTTPKSARGSRACEELCDLSFRHVGYRLRRGGANNGAIDILQDVTGSIRSTALTAILGSSGAGKTTLLKLLACHISGGEQSGTVYANGLPIVEAEFKNQLAVVWQSDVLLSTATVKEAIVTSALLKLPQQMPRHEKMQRVEEILTELDLQHCKHTRIGLDIDGAVSGISGGERRRVSVGIGLVTDARVLFLDEPTTGLDSESAEALIGLLSGLAAAKRRTIVCTIHQPSSDICNMFDDLILMSCGRLLYCGSWMAADTYFADAGFKRPEYRSTAEHMLHLCKDKEYAVPALASAYTLAVSQAAKRYKSAVFTPKTGRGKTPHRALDVEDPATPGNAAAGLHRRAASLSLTATATTPHSARPLPPALSRPSVPEQRQAGGPTVATSRFYQVRVLSSRFLRSWGRSPVHLVVQAAQYIIAALLLGAMYWRLGNDTSSGTYDRAASIWFAALCVIFQSGNNACTIFYSQKPLLRREISSGLYHYSAFYVAKGLTSLPFQLAYAVIFNATVYFLVGYQITVAKFFTYFLLMSLMMLISETLGMLCAGLCRSELVGAIVLQGLYVPLLIFTGFFQTRTPEYLVWIKRISYVAYGYSGLIKNEFTGLRLTAPGGFEVEARSLIPPNIENGLDIGRDAWVLVGILVGMRIITFFQMLVSIRLRWL